MRIKLFIILMSILTCSYCLNQFGITKTITAMVMLEETTKISKQNPQDAKYIKWMEFNVPLEVMKQALKYDIDSYNKDVQIDWIELISYGAARKWGKFDKGKKCTEIDEVVLKLQSGEKMSDLTSNLKLYDFYLQTYGAVLGGFVGEYAVEEASPDNPEKKIYTRKYGLKVFSPIAQGFYYSHYDDFGDSRSYGYKRRHLGNDLMGSVGTPIVAVEDGYVEALGWNELGGWRIGIRSHDKKRYYYYAHLKKNKPYAATLKLGDNVQAGDVIGYLGMTGYSCNENVNNIKIPHLHFGMQIIFDETQKDGKNQIWIDVYELINFLGKNRMKVYKDTEKNEYLRSVNVKNFLIY